MSKDYTGTKLSNILLRIVIPWKEEEINEPIKYHAGLLKSQAKVLNDDSREVSVVYDQTKLGNPKAQPWTLKQIYDYFDNLCPPLAAKLKKLYEDGINVDPST